jgi:hypothetical protein
MSESIEGLDQGGEIEEKPNGASKPFGQDDLEDIKRQLDESRAEKEALARRAARAETERDEARGAHQNEAGRRWQAEEQVLDSGLSALETELDTLQDRYAALMENGEFKEAGKVQRRISEAAAEAQLTRQKKVWLADAKRIEETQRTVAPQSEGFDWSKFSVKQRRFIEDKFPDYVTDARLQNRARAAHFDAVDEYGYALDSPEYFAHIEKRLGGTARAAPVEEEEEAPAPQPRRRAPPEVPVQRRGQATQQREVALRLTEDEREAADFSMPNTPIEDEVDGKGNIVRYGRYRQYKINQKALRDQGRLN